MNNTTVMTNPVLSHPVILLLDLSLLLLLLHFLPYPAPITKALSLLIFIAVLWLTEATHVTVTALLVPILAVSLGIFELQPALSHFSNATIFLFFGGFALAAALHKQNLDHLLASKILSLAKGKLFIAVLMLFAISAFLSMWISNTATVAMMLPLAIGMAGHLDQEQDRNSITFILLGVAYSASIGGIGTLVGSPPNVIAAAQTGLSFIQWMRIGIPIVLILLPVAIGILFFFFKPKLHRRYTPEKITFTWTINSKLTLAIFVCTVIAWICSLPLSNLLGGIAQFDTLIALIAAVLICLTGVASWRDIERQTEWGVLVLFGGGIALSAVLKETGTSLFLAQHITAAFAATSPLFLFCIIASFVVFLTEFTSNTATAALLVPLFAGVAESLGISVIITSVMVSVACSCAFMLPVATPPNAIVFSSGLIRQKDMIRVGLLLNIACIILLTGLFYVDI